MVVVRTGATSVPLQFRPGKDAIAWGVSNVEAANLALAILDDVLFEQPERALKLMQRFKWRVVKDWAVGSSWSITEEEVLAHIADIEKTERDTATGRRRMANERGIIPNIAGIPGEIGWEGGVEPTLNPNHQRKT